MLFGKLIHWHSIAMQSETLSKHPSYLAVFPYLTVFVKEYLYLLFSDGDTIPLDKNIFNTEVSERLLGIFLSLTTSMRRPTYYPSLRRRGSRFLARSTSLSRNVTLRLYDLTTARRHPHDRQEVGWIICTMYTRSHTTTA